ncbi:hypothetical protein T11_6556 [Trichinella zimbabwensis]|uniref:Uncharacterized protein n=1 Tax=Trichinella zimbabwensis TaxID=268475 RepID=A0A0V1HH32_9BILA|nr:hypothetical protein T11_6556 [Trichinella zimbabwensis]
MTGIDQKKSENYNEPGLTLHESVFVEILLKTLNLDVILVGTTEGEIKHAKVANSKYVCT